MDTFGRYRIVREVGRGAMGRVYLAHDPEIDRPVAIKTIQVFEGLPEGERGEARDRFVREARAAGKLLHPAIVTVFDAGDAGGVPYLAMEYVEGRTLDHHVRRENALPVEIVAELIARAAEGLAFAHRAGIVHRDVKPANLMRVGDRAAKIMDFGLARSAVTHLTQDGALLGTPSYMSPEQIRGGEVDGRSDLFSLAVVLYELLAGAKPFAGESVSSVLFRIVHEEPADLTPHLHRVPRSMAEFLRKALAKDPAARFPDGDAFAAALRAAANERESGARPPGADAGGSPSSIPPREDPRRGGSRGAFWSALAVLVVVGGAMGAWMLLQGPPAPPPPPEWTSTVHTEPPGLPVLRDGALLEDREIRYPGVAPFPVLTLELGCRRVEHRVTPADAGREIVLVPDPTETDVVVSVDFPEAEVRVNGAAAGAPGTPIRLDLCRENRLEVRAEGHRPASVDVAAGATPLQARTAVAALRLEPLPKGELALPDPGYPVRWTVAGNRVAGRAPRLELPEGTYRVRAVSESAWVDVEAEVEVAGGETRTPDLPLPKLGRLRVQAFPANARVFARRSGTSGWTLLDDAPLDQRLAAGRYQVRVEFLPSGKSVEKTIDLRPGDNAPVRVGMGEAR